MRTVCLAGAAGAVAALLVLATPRPARADGGPFGLGLIIGSPTGISGKYYLGGTGEAIDFAIGGALGGDRGLHVHADYLWHPVMLTQDAAFNLPLHVGVGARLLDHDRGKDDGDDDFHIGVRVPGGITFDFTEVPIDVFIELALIMDFRAGDRHDDSIGLDLNAGVGVRYYF
jgi:hypothetical protein